MKQRIRALLAKPPPAKPGEINYALVDRFTFIHMAIGFAYGITGLPFGIAFVLAIAWELLENPLKANLSFLFPHATADSLQNMAGDILAVSVGWVLSRYFLY